MQSLLAFLLIFGDNKIAFKIALELFFYPSTLEFGVEEKIHTKTVVNVSRGTGGRVFPFFLRETGRGLVGTYILQ